MIIDENYNVIESHNREHSGTIEGLGPIFNYLKAIDDNVSEDTIFIANWATNNKLYYEGKETTTYELMKAMLNSPMYTPSYELSKYLFENGPKRDEYINSK